jgi:hypothetical protein
VKNTTRLLEINMAAQGKQYSADSAGVMSSVKTVPPLAGSEVQVPAKQYNLRKWVARG